MIWRDSAAVAKSDDHFDSRVDLVCCTLCEGGKKREGFDYI